MGMKPIMMVKFLSNQKNRCSKVVRYTLGSSGQVSEINECTRVIRILITLERGSYHLFTIHPNELYADMLSCKTYRTGKRKDVLKKCWPGCCNVSCGPLR